MGTAIFGGGCFWCTEAVFKRVKGVINVESGYAGGFIKNPAYREVCNGTTGHAEVVKIDFDPENVSYEELLRIFFVTHDPTTLNKQGNDVGTQYRSVIFYFSEEQRLTALNFIAKLEGEQYFPGPIVTEVLPYVNFYKAEEYHQDYYANNTLQPYCSYIITPKLQKFGKMFPELSLEGLK
ncbi:MAG TPA: peptide-methionine (S)-S-oxide reductase MsrA [Bacteroidales bacterium]|nr:peptide-methionine (S)-S-oxide reductase MsrA [Bacteroidales bacterium]